MSHVELDNILLFDRAVMSSFLENGLNLLTMNIDIPTTIMAAHITIQTFRDNGLNTLYSLSSSSCGLFVRIPAPSST